MRLNLKLTTLTLGLLGSALFASCVIYGLLVPANMHLAPAFDRVSAAGFSLADPGKCGARHSRNLHLWRVRRSPADPDLQLGRSANRVRGRAVMVVASER